MRRLQMEVARKAPLTVKIPEEITVGELASRMKKTAAEVIKLPDEERRHGRYQPDHRF